MAMLSASLTAARPALAPRRAAARRTTRRAAPAPRAAADSGGDFSPEELKVNPSLTPRSTLTLKPRVPKP